METQAENKASEIELRFIRIKDKELSFSDTSYLTDDTGKVKSGVHFQVQMNGQHRVIPDSSLFEMVFSIAFAKKTSNDDEESEVILKYTTSTLFEIKNFNEVIIPKGENNFFVPSELLHMTTEVIVSTMRGLLAEKTANSNFKELYIPLINSKKVSDHLFGGDEE